MCRLWCLWRRDDEVWELYWGKGCDSFVHTGLLSLTSIIRCELQKGVAISKPDFTISRPST